MRPLIAAEPMLRAPSPDVVLESTRTLGACRLTSPACVTSTGGFLVSGGFGSVGFTGSAAFGCCLDASRSTAGCVGAAAPGLANLESSSGTLASIRSHAYCALFALELPLDPIAEPKGMN